MEDYQKIEVRELAVSTKEKHYLLSYNETYYEASETMVELLKTLQACREEEEAIASFMEQKPGKYNREQLFVAIDQYLKPILKKQKGEKKRTFLYQKELFTAEEIEKFSKAFRFLFNLWVMVPVLVVCLILNLHFLFSTSDLLQFNNQINVYTALGLFIFMVLSSFFHEIGHASACKYFGVGHGGIGFGLYLNFPVLYTDVTAVWKLNRKQRCVVNLAGVYFQSFLFAILLALFFLTHNDIIRYLVLTMNLGFLMTLNPFFKFDGYWIMSDLLGVPNLRERSKELLQYMYKRIRKQTVTRIPYLLKINKLEGICMLIYSILVNLFMGYYFFYIIPKFLYTFVQSFPGEVKQLILYLSNNITPPFSLLRNIGMQFIFLALIIILLTNLVRSLKIYARKK